MMIKADKKKDEKSLSEDGSEDQKIKSKKDENISEKKVSIEDKLKSTEDKLLRVMAEMENQRRRFEKEREDAFEFGGFAFAKESLALIDNLERAKKSFESDKKLKENEDFPKILEAFAILENDLISIFKRNNIEQIICLNKKFDPNFHQAMIEIDDSTKDPGTVVQEIQKGYTMKDRLLRPSLVGVTRFKVQDIKKDEENMEKNDIKK